MTIIMIMINVMIIKNIMIMMADVLMHLSSHNNDHDYGNAELQEKYTSKYVTMSVWFVDLWAWNVLPSTYQLAGFMCII